MFHGKQIVSDPTSFSPPRVFVAIEPDAISMVTNTQVVMEVTAGRSRANR
ncbi:hypothetical protein H4V99_001426 [Cryobacterium sp. CG_9.6]|nr:hypothetical protein [Cryobacterium sp. CG_9.6]